MGKLSRIAHTQPPGDADVPLVVHDLGRFFFLRQNGLENNNLVYGAYGASYLFT